MPVYSSYHNRMAIVLYEQCKRARIVSYYCQASSSAVLVCDYLVLHPYCNRDVLLCLCYERSRSPVDDPHYNRNKFACIVLHRCLCMTLCLHVLMHHARNVCVSMACLVHSCMHSATHRVPQPMAGSALRSKAEEQGQAEQEQVLGRAGGATMRSMRRRRWRASNEGEEEPDTERERERAEEEPRGGIYEGAYFRVQICIGRSECAALHVHICSVI